MDFLITKVSRVLPGVGWMVLWAAKFSVAF